MSISATKHNGVHLQSKWFHYISYNDVVAMYLSSKFFAPFEFIVQFLYIFHDLKENERDHEIKYVDMPQKHCEICFVVFHCNF